MDLPVRVFCGLVAIWSASNLYKEFKQRSATNEFNKDFQKKIDNLCSNNDTTLLQVGNLQLEATRAVRQNWQAVTGKMEIQMSDLADRVIDRNLAKCKSNGNCDAFRQEWEKYNGMLEQRIRK
jgi:hypothetical protein